MSTPDYTEIRARAESALNDYKNARLPLDQPRTDLARDVDARSSFVYAVRRPAGSASPCAGLAELPCITRYPGLPRRSDM